jgi:hypothetical protein
MKLHHQQLYITPTAPLLTRCPFAPTKMPNHLLPSTYSAENLISSYLSTPANPMMPSIDTKSLCYHPRGLTTLLNLDTSITTVGAADLPALVPSVRTVVLVALVVSVGVGLYRAIPRLKRVAALVRYLVSLSSLVTPQMCLARRKGKENSNDNALSRSPTKKRQLTKPKYLQQQKLSAKESRLKHRRNIRPPYRLHLDLEAQLHPRHPQTPWPRFNPTTNRWDAPPTPPSSTSSSSSSSCTPSSSSFSTSSCDFSWEQERVRWQRRDRFENLNDLVPFLSPGERREVERELGRWVEEGWCSGREG